MTPLGLYNAPRELLDEAIAILGVGAPSRCYVSVGEPAFDCDQMTTHITGFGVAATNQHQASGDPKHARAVLYEARIDLLVVRCYTDEGALPSLIDTTVKLPTVPALTAVSEVLHTDAWTLWRELRKRIVDGSLFAGPGCRGTSLGPLVPLGEQGALNGWRLTVTVEVSGGA